MFNELKEINKKPKPFQFYTADELWTNEYTAKQMLIYHLNDSVDLSSRNKNFIDKSVDWIVSEFNVVDNTKIADFGCGPGLYSSRFAQRGAKVTGIDFSKNSIDYAKTFAAEKDLKINYLVENYLEFDTTERFDLIIMIMCDFSALSPEQRKVMLSKFKNLLNDGGSVLLDVHSLARYNKIEESASYEFNQLQGFWSADDYYGFVNTFKYDDEKVILDKYTIIEKSRKRVVYNWLQHYSDQALIKEFNDNGFNVDKLYSDVAGKSFDPLSDEIAIVANKK